MAIELEDLKPYKSILIASVVPPAAGTPAEPVTAVLETFQESLTDSDAVEVLHPPSSDEVGDGSVVGFLIYSDRRRPAWLETDSESELFDLEHHLLLVCHHRQQVAALLTDKRRKRKLESTIRRLDELDLASPTKVRNAFVRGPALALWMAGIHPSVTIKPDSKTLFGQNLRDAIDPMGDQTYLVTAARSRVRDLDLAIGSSMRGSRIWIGPSRDWEDCIETVFSVLDYLAKDLEEEPLPFVPRTVDPGHEVDLHQAYELHLLPPELMGDTDQLAAEDKQMMERWAYDSQLEIESGGDDHLRVAVRLNDQRLAEVRLDLDLEDPARVEVKSEIVAEAEGAEEDDLEELGKVLGHDRWLRVWFHSGETLVDGQLCTQQYLELPFQNYQWQDFTGVDVKTEKFWSGAFPPNPLEAIDEIPEQGPSLFSWTKSHWPADNELARSTGWLACDDGSMEIADFIHLDDTANPPVLSLIHAKAAKSNAENRTLSVASYQIVISQALRNLRYLYRESVSTNFLAGVGKKISKLVWHQGVPDNRKNMVKALEKAAGNYRRQVVVLQPQVTRARLEAARDPEDRDHAALQQLDTLFLATAESCRQLQAVFTVVADNRSDAK